MSDTRPNSTNPSSAPLKKSALICGGALAIPLSFAGLPLYLHAPDFYASQMGLSLALIGVIILCIRLFDAIQDPLIGILSDKFAHHRVTIMMGALVALIISFMMVFHPPKTSDIVMITWFGASLLIASTAFSILSINLNAIGSLWSAYKTQKTRITTYREGLGLIGLLIAASLPTFFGLPFLAYVLTALCIITGALFYIWSKNHRNIVTRIQEFQFNWRKLLTPSMRRYFIIYSISMLASSIPGVLVIFFVRDLIGAEHLTGLFLILYFVSGAIGMPLWQKLSSKKSIEMAWLISMMLAIATFIWAYFIGEGSIIPYAIICVLSGLALGAELALPPALLSALIDKEQDETQTGLYFSAQTFLLKTTFALGSGLSFLVIGLSDFEPAVQNTPEALHALSFTYALLPCLIKIIAAFMLYFWIKDKAAQETKGENNDSQNTHSDNRRTNHA